MGLADRTLSKNKIAPGGKSSTKGCNMIGRGGKCGDATVVEGIENWGKFWNMVVDEKHEGCCYILECTTVETSERSTVSEGDKPIKKNCNVTIPGGLSRAVHLRIPRGISLELQFKVNIQQSANFGLMLVGGVSEKSKLNIDIVAELENKGSSFKAMANVVCLSGAEARFDTRGKLGPKAENSKCNFDIKVLQIGEKSLIAAEPSLEILNENCDATHGFSVDRVPGEAIAYLANRGLSRKEAEELYAKGFVGGDAG